jgi:hypothetical protein
LKFAAGGGEVSLLAVGIGVALDDIAAQRLWHGRIVSSRSNRVDPSPRRYERRRKEAQAQERRSEDGDHSRRSEEWVEREERRDGGRSGGWRGDDGRRDDQSAGCEASEGRGTVIMKG